MLFEIRETNRKHHRGESFHLYFNRKNGLKFKKGFVSQKKAEQFANSYLQYCCPKCLQNGIVSRVSFIDRSRGPVGKRLYGGAMGIKEDASGICFDCKGIYSVHYEWGEHEWQNKVFRHRLAYLTKTMEGEQ